MRMNWGHETAHKTSPPLHPLVESLTPGDDPQPVRGFSAFTADLEALAAWLATCGVTTVALA